MGEVRIQAIASAAGRAAVTAAVLLTKAEHRLPCSFQAETSVPNVFRYPTMLFFALQRKVARLRSCSNSTGASGYRRYRQPAASAICALMGGAVSAVFAAMVCGRPEAIPSGSLMRTARRMRAACSWDCLSAAPPVATIQVLSPRAYRTGSRGGQGKRNGGLEPDFFGRGKDVTL